MIDRHVKEHLERDRNRQSWTSLLHVKAKEELGDLGPEFLQSEGRGARADVS